MSVERSRWPSGLEALAAIAHELRGPLHAISTSAELLTEDTAHLDLQTARAMAATIHRQTLWLQGLVENLLSTAAIQEGRFYLHPQPLRLEDVFRDIAPIFQPLLARKGQVLHAQLDEAVRHPDVLVLADSRRLGQVLVNLIMNASKFSPPGTAIEVQVAPRDDAVRVTVADRGQGLPAGGADHLFQPFYRAAEATQAGTEGAGLGLAIVKAIVDAHGGRVGAQNRPGGGACFWFELPTPFSPAGH